MRRGVAVVENRSMFKDDQNPFEVLGIEMTFDINLAALDEAYFARQTLAHPDRFVYHSEPERQAAATQSSALNRAYETLKSPSLRAKALLKLRGIEVGGEEGKSVHDAEILEEMMDLQEAVINAISPQEVNLVTDQIQGRLNQVTTSFGEVLQKDKVQELPRLFLRLTYLSKLMGDIKIHQQQSSLKIL
jgi:molecular chaperone HscB